MAQVDLEVTFESSIDIPFGKSESLSFDAERRNILRINDGDGVVAGDEGRFGCYHIDTPTVPIHTLDEADFTGINGPGGEVSDADNVRETECVAYNPDNKKVYVLSNLDSAPDDPAIWELEWTGSAYEITTFMVLPAFTIVNPQCAAFGPDGTLYVGDAGLEGATPSDTLDIYTLTFDLNVSGSGEYTFLTTINFPTPNMQRDFGDGGGPSKGYGIEFHEGNLLCIGYQGDGGGGVRFKRFIEVFNLSTLRSTAHYSLNTTPFGSANRGSSNPVRGITIIDGEIYTSTNTASGQTNAISIYSFPVGDVIEYDSFMGRDYLDGYNVEHITATGVGVSVATAIGSPFPALAGQSIVSSMVMGTSLDTSGAETCNVALYEAFEYSPGDFRPTGEILYTSQELTLVGRGAVNGGTFFRAVPVQEVEDFSLIAGTTYIPVFYATGTNDSAYLNAKGIGDENDANPVVADPGVAATDDGTGGTPPTDWTSTDLLFLAEATFGFGVVTLAGLAPVLTTPYTTIVLDRGTSGSINLAPNWSGASTFLIQELPLWMEQSGTTGTLNYTNVQWGGKNSENTIGGGVWSIQVQAIDSTGLLTTETSIWLYVRR